MKVIAAYLLAVLGGNNSPSADDLKKILDSGTLIIKMPTPHIDRHTSIVKFICRMVGAEAEDDQIDFLLLEVKRKDITELIASGRQKLASIPSAGGGGAAAVAVAAFGGGSGGAAPAAAEAKKEEKVEEKEKSNDDMGFSVFDYALPSLYSS